MPPLDELFGHDLVTNCLHYDPVQQVVVSGGKDGSLIVRAAANLAEVRATKKVHNIVSHGVSSVFYSSQSKLLISGGFDGSLVIDSVGKINLDRKKV